MTLLVSLVLLVSLTRLSEAHVKLFYAPNNWPIRNAATAVRDGTFSTATSDGCGGQPMWGRNGATKLTVGQSVYMEFNYGTTVNGDHKSAANQFRVVFASFDNAPDIAAENAALKAGTVLKANIAAVEGSRPRPYNATVTIPNVMCKRCVLQVVDQRGWGACYDVFTLAGAVVPSAAATTTRAPTTAAPGITTTRAPGATTTTAQPTTSRAATTTFTTGTTGRVPMCGNGIVEAGEQCDQPSGCCTGCRFTPAGVVCRPRDGALGCDADDVCSGTSATCDDLVMARGAVCRAAPADGSACVGDAKCDGVMGQCPPTNPVSVGKECDDGEKCTENDVCGRNGRCYGTWTCPCKTDSQCDTDKDTCTFDQCKVTDGVGACNRDDSMDRMEGAECSDDNACTAEDTCNAEGVCVGVKKCTKAPNACGEAERRGTCCNNACICNAGWTGDACDKLAPSCPVGNKNCPCNSAGTCAMNFVCDAARQICAEAAATTVAGPGVDDTAGAATLSMCGVVALLAIAFASS
jgi:hypothetical protein